MVDPRIEIVEMAMADVAVSVPQPLKLELLARIAISVVDAYESGYAAGEESKEEPEESEYCPLCRTRHPREESITIDNFMEKIFGPTDDGEQ